jgi:hypothetical protein
MTGEVSVVRKKHIFIEKCNKAAYKMDGFIYLRMRRAFWDIAPCSLTAADRRQCAASFTALYPWRFSLLVFILAAVRT